MKLLPTEIIEINQRKLAEVESLVKSIYRLIIYSKDHSDDDLLNIYLKGMHNLTELVGIKNAQMEAQNEEEAREYLNHLKLSLDFVIEEIILQNNFEKEIQLFQLLRIISPEANAAHPNRYRQTLVQIGNYLCPEPYLVPQLVSEHFYQMQGIKNTVIRALYLHHELIRIHPFVDGNGRVTRIAKNWILMYDLYPPIFINDAMEKKEYIYSLSNSFRELSARPDKWNEYTHLFFEQELDRLLTNALLLYESINQIGVNRKQQNLTV